ncbi:helix-turn-helix domain-containing protein [Mesorhizobium australicum]|uniref:Helix-turn-helix domain-containing protein n=1 Tax=Mesorhizobium australicum TaxID=536018 RepID=A0ACC6T7E5_9HYPH
MLKTLTSAQSRAGRALVKWSVRDLSEKCGVHRNTISAFETDQTEPNGSTLTVLRQALETAGVEFIPENGGGAGVRLRKTSP